MIAAYLYQWIYLFIISIITVVVVNQYKNRDSYDEFINSGNEIINILIVISLIVFIGLRPSHTAVFGDTAAYTWSYERFYDGSKFYFDPHATNIIFDNLYKLWGSLSLGLQNFFLFISAIYFGCSYLGIRRIFPNHKLAAYLVFLAAFSTFSYGTNGIKAGAAASLFIWAYGYRQNLKICIPLILLSWGFHHSMQLPVAAFILSLFYKNSKLYFCAWCFCLIISLLHIGIFADLFASMSDDTGAEYLSGNINGTEGTQGGFRFDFVLYSSMPVLVGYYAVIKKQLQITDTYRNLLHLYLCTNGIWMLCMYANFTNRIAYLSWFIYPIVLIYPFLYEDWGLDKYKKFANVMALHLIFTLFMEIVYY